MSTSSPTQGPTRGQRPPARGSPTSSSRTRLPSTRERRPALAAVGILLVAGGALASAWLALQVSDRVDYLRIAPGAEVAQGAEITGPDLELVALPEDLDEGIRADDEGAVVGQRAATRLLGGTILTPDMMGEDSGLATGESGYSAELGPAALELLSDAGSGAEIRIIVPREDGDPVSVPARIVTVSRPSDGGGFSGQSSTGLATYIAPVQCGPALGSADDTELDFQTVLPDDSVAFADACGGIG